jgi:hypothetical protein
MTTRRLLLFVALDFLPTILAGHGYDVGSSSRRESDGEDEIAGLTMPWIIAAGSLALITAGLLVWLNPDLRRRARSVAPKAVIVLIIAAPLVAWTATSGDETKEALKVDRETALTGAPELLISLGDDDVNTLKTTGGKRTVRVRCVGRDGKVVLAARTGWPFVDERGYDYAHTHVVATRAQVQRAQSCRLLGTSPLLQAEVEGRLPR